MKLTSFIALVAIGAIGLVGVDRYKTHVANVEATPIAAPESRAPQPEPVATPVEDRSWIKPRDNAPTTNAAAPGAKKLAWAPWENPEIPGVSGSVVWNQSAQKGYMTFKGLPANDPAKGVERIQAVLDPHCLAGVTIQAADKLDARPGPAKAALAEQGWRAFLVKVANPSGVAKVELRADSRP